MLRVKPGASFKKIQPQMVLALIAIDQEYEREGVECWVTSGDDSKHRTGSLHYVGYALDFRTFVLDKMYDGLTPEQLNSEKRNLAARIQDRLGPEYRVIFEATTPTRTEHIHVEYRGLIEP